MRACLAIVIVVLSSAVVALAVEPSRPISSRQIAQQGPALPLVLTRSLEFGDGVWPDENPEQSDYQLVRPKQAFGPPESEPRKTLFQWSYGTSFEGGINLEEDALQTDRPDFVEASTTVGKGVLQIESGYTYVRNKDAGDDTISHSIGEVLFRYGVLEDWIELRFGVFPFSESTTGAIGPTVHTSGVSHLYLGTKLGLTPQEGYWPEMALLPQMTVPISSDGRNSSDVLPGVNWLYGWDVTDFIGVGASTQFNSGVDGETGHKYTEWAQAITINYNLTDDVGAYTEWFALFPSGADTEEPQHYIDGGFTYRPTPDTQFDIRAGIGLTDASDDYFVGTGFSIRIK